MELVTAPEGEILYGGAAGGGKTAGVLAAALQYADVPGYHALILRRTMKQLEKADSILELCKQWVLPRADYNGTTHTFTFPSGATIEFGHCKDEESKRNYDGPAYQFIGFDEACHFSETQFSYIAFGRQRRRVDSTVPLRVILSAMPGGPGHEWVKRRFVIPHEENKMPAGRRYIPARLEDNPFIDQDDYREKLANMAGVDPTTATRMAAGDWNVIAGSRFDEDWFRYWYLVKGAGGWWADCAGERFNLWDCVRFLTIDTASTAKEQAKEDPDYYACSAWAIAARYLIWLGLWHKQTEGPKAVPHVVEMYARYKAGIAYVEETGQNKPSQWLKLHPLPLGGYMNVKGYSKGSLDKLVFNTPFINMVAAGRVWFPGDDPQLSIIKGQLLLFTGNEKIDAHDDIVDTGGAAARVIDNVKMSAAAANAPDYGYEPVGPRKGSFG